MIDCLKIRKKFKMCLGYQLLRWHSLESAGILHVCICIHGSSVLFRWLALPAYLQPPPLQSKNRWMLLKIKIAYTSLPKEDKSQSCHPDFQKKWGIRMEVKVCWGPWWQQMKAIAQTLVEFTCIHRQGWGWGGGLGLPRESCGELKSIFTNVNFITKCQ